MAQRLDPSELAARVAELSQILKSLHMDSKDSDEAWLGLDLSMAQLKALMIVLHANGGGGVASRMLADKMRIGPSAVTPLVDKLEQQKLVKREDDAADRRVVLIRATAKAQALHAKLVEASRAALAQVIDEVPAGKRAEVGEGLNILIEAARRVVARNSQSHSQSHSPPPSKGAAE